MKTISVISAICFRINSRTNNNCYFATRIYIWIRTSLRLFYHRKQNVGLDFFSSSFSLAHKDLFNSHVKCVSLCGIDIESETNKTIKNAAPSAIALILKFTATQLNTLKRVFIFCVDRWRIIVLHIYNMYVCMRTMDSVNTSSNTIWSESTNEKKNLKRFMHLSVPL